MKVLINSHSKPFNPKNLVTGNSIRAHTLGESLKKNGFEVKYLIEKTFADKKYGRDFLIYEDRFELLDILEREKPEGVIFIQGENLEYLKGKKWDFLIIGDFIAPTLVEYHFQGLSFEEWFFKITNRISTCDYILCSTPIQKAYYLNLLMCSGFDISEDRVKILPISGENIQLEKGGKVNLNPIRVVMGGVMWPWINPERFLYEFIKKVEEKGLNLKIKIFKGKYPHTIGSEKYFDYTEKFLEKKCMEISNFLPYGKLLEEYKRSTLAFDLFEKNAERELSFSFRSIDYLNCGLPIISREFTYIGKLIEKYNAGWTVREPEDLENILDEIKEEENIIEKRKNAKKLFEEKFNIEKNIEILTEIIKSGTKKEGKRNFVEIFSPFFDKLLEETFRKSEEIKNLKDENSLLKRERESCIEKYRRKEIDHAGTLKVVEEQKNYIEKIEKNLENSIKLINEKDVSLKEQEYIIRDLKNYSKNLELEKQKLNEKIKDLNFEIDTLNSEIATLKALLSKKLVRISLKIDSFFRKKDG